MYRPPPVPPCFVGKATHGVFCSALDSALVAVLRSRLLVPLCFDKPNYCTNHVVLIWHHSMHWATHILAAFGRLKDGYCRSRTIVMRQLIGATLFVLPLSNDQGEVVRRSGAAKRSSCELSHAGLILGSIFSSVQRWPGAAPVVAGRVQSPRLRLQLMAVVCPACQYFARQFRRNRGN